MVTKENFDLVISDWNLGKSTNAGEVVKLALENNIPTIIHSMYLDDEEINPFREKVRVYDKMDCFKYIPLIIDETQKGMRER